MWSFQGRTAVQSPDASREPPSYHTRTQSSSRDRLSSYQPQLTNSEKQERPFNSNGSSSRHLSWSHSVSDSTLTDTPALPHNVDVEKESTEKTGPPTPVSFWSPALAATRKIVFLKYTSTCMCYILPSPLPTNNRSIRPLPLCTGSSLNILGRLISHQDQPASCHHRCGRLRWPGSPLRQRRAIHRSVRSNRSPSGSHQTSRPRLHHPTSRRLQLRPFSSTSSRAQ